MFIIKTYKIDYELSCRAFKYLGDKIVANSCYNNAFNTIEFVQMFLKREYKIAYGYISSSIGDVTMLFRHAIIVLDNNIGIDATQILLDKNKKKIEDMMFYTFGELTIDEFIVAIQKEEMLPRLTKYLINEEIEFIDKVYDESNKEFINTNINPVDLMDALSLFHKDDFEKIMEKMKTYSKVRV